MPLRAAHRRRAQAMDISISNSTVQQQKAQLRSIKHYWHQYGDQFKTWWSKQSKEDRQRFLLDWCPYMPLARDKPYTIVDGKREELYGGAMVLPEWNQKDLLEGNRLIKVLAETAEIADYPATLSYPGHDAYYELCYNNMHVAFDMVGRLNTLLSAEEYVSGIVLVTPDHKFGKALVVKQMHPEIQRWLSKGSAVRSPVYEALIYRLNLVLSQVAVCLDHFRLEVLGKKCYKAIAPKQGCAQCGAVEPKDANRLNLLCCGACGVVFYCGEECQHAHWRTHKPDCKPKALRDQEKNSRQQEAAASAAAATHSSAEAGSSSISSKHEQQKILSMSAVAPQLIAAAETAQPAAASRLQLRLPRRNKLLHVRPVSFLLLILSASLMWICLTQVSSSA